MSSETVHYIGPIVMLVKTIILFIYFIIIITPPPTTTVETSFTPTAKSTSVCKHIYTMALMA